jgi:hypothetical protein
MPREQVPDTDLSYFLIAFDALGRERTDDPDGLMSGVIQDALAAAPVTDVFLISHGWNGDVPAARRQYNKWLRTMHGCQADRQRMRQVRPNFRPLIIGVHWPSLAWGDETLAADVSFTPSAPDPVESLVDDYAQRIANTGRARQALRTIVTVALDNPPAEELPPDVLAAYQVLDDESGLQYGGAGGRPGDDREDFDPEAIFEISNADAVSFGLFDSNSWLAPLRTLSFWQMKARGCHVGEHGVGDFCRKLLTAVDASVRFHLMGHSFGCIVCSAVITGPGPQVTLPRAVNSLVLVQGALSLWAYCSAIPRHGARAGYFHRLIAEGSVAGPILTTFSRHDLALANVYPWGAMSARQVALAAPGELPTYGALGAWGARGPGIDLVNLDMLAVDQPYDFESHKVYNLESSHVINQREGIAGAHNDIAKPEVAHAVWSAAIGTV